MAFENQEFAGDMMKAIDEIKEFGLCPPNLAALGRKRAIGTDKDGPPDLITVWRTPYPVLSNYEKMCLEAKIHAYAGGTWQKQGPHWKEGYISSGFRELLGAKNTPHKFGIAIDVIVIGLPRQIEIAQIAVDYFMRVGIYPDDNIMHFDLAPLIWQRKYHGTPFWVKLNEKYTAFLELEEAIKFAQDRRG